MPANKNPNGERPLGELRSRRTAAAVILLAFACVAGARTLRVAVVTDGPAGRQVFSAEAIEKEIVNVASADTTIILPAESRFTGDWSLDGANAALDRALADRSVDMVITIGILTSQQAARRSALSKPVIAPLVIDPILQGYPLTEGHSGRRNFTYVADFQSVGNEVRAFHDIVGFKYLVALVDDSIIGALPQLA